MHLSDLHVGCLGQAAWWATREAFRLALKQWLERLGPPDLVLFTGDLTNRALAAEFAALDSFWAWLQAEIRKVDKNATPVLLPVPGNHDLVRPTKAAVRSHRWASDVLAVPAAFDDIVAEGAPAEIVAMFAPWQQWFDRTVVPTVAGRGTLHRSPLPGDWSLKLERKDRPPLVVVGLNSAWAHYQDVQKEQIALPPLQFLRALASGAVASPLELFTEDSLALLLQHHPPDWLSPANRSDFDRQIYAPGRFAACLFGHMHEGRSHLEGRSGGRERAFFQSPSLFGADTYGKNTERPHSGFTFGEIDESGEVRLWPLRLVPQGGGEKFDWDQEFDRRGKDDRGEHVILQPARPPKPSATKPASKGKSDGSPPLAKSHAAAAAERQRLETYRTWSLARHARLELIGLDAGDYPLSLDSVYVPLRASGRAPSKAHHGRTLAYDELAERLTDEDVDLLDLFANATAAMPHVVLLGEPGSGKSTALRKVLQVAWNAPSTLRGLAADTVPVFLPLRACNRRSEGGDFEILPILASGDAKALFSFLLRDPIVADEKLDAKGVADRIDWLWRQPLLLLLDGLDEVAEALRPKVAAFLRSELTKARNVRAVVSSRIASYTDDVDLKERFATFTVRALKAEQVYEFVRQWFPAVRDLVRNLDVEGAAKAADRLISTLQKEQYSSQQLMSLVSSPLMLTLLCIVVLRGGDMPRARVQFYDKGLRVLLETWRKAKELQAAPLSVDAAIEVLKRVAYRLHENGQQDLSRMAMADALDVVLVERQIRIDGFAMLQWLHEACGVMSSPGPDEFRFAHLGFQEYLTALYLAELPQEEQVAWVDQLVAAATEKWWREVALLFVSVPRCATFSTFVPALLRTEAAVAEATAPMGHEEGPYLALARACLETAEQPDVRPLVTMLASEGNDNRRAFLLRVLHGRTDPELLEEARKLCSSGHHDVKARAAQIVEQAQRGAGESPVVVVYGAAAVSSAQEVVAGMLARGLGAQQFSVENVGDLEVRLPTLLASARWLVAVPSVGDFEPWRSERVQRALEMLRRRLLKSSAVLGAASGDFAAYVGFSKVLALVDWVAGQVSAAGSRTVGAETAATLALPGFVRLAEQQLGIRLLRVPAGEFTMGLEEQWEAKPLHPVRLSEFWLAETSITNAQYREFVKATRHPEPERWRDRKYAGDDQPVVEVSWEDATKFCEWLTGAIGTRVVLPTEAQREFAARGTDGRRYPWGKEEPDATRAHYDKDWRKDAPMPVGSFPAGRGLWGHADLAGNVWEWCADVWNANVYWSRSKTDPTQDPVVVDGDRSVRCLRGGGFVYSADFLRVGIRHWYWADYRRHGIGFRVAVSPASTV